MMQRMLIDHMFLTGCALLYVHIHILYTIILKLIQLENWFSPPFVSNHMNETILRVGCCAVDL